jgi:hypothetical protein
VALKALETLKHEVLKIILVIDLGRRQGLLIPLTSVVKFVSSRLKRLELW